MNKIFQIFVLGTLLVSCGNDNQQTVDDLISAADLNALRAKKSELFEQQKVLENEMKKLDSVIGSMSGNENLPLVTTVIANTQKFDHYLDLQGDVKTKQNVLIYPEMQGVLQRVYVKEGQQVSKGQILATIDDGGMGSQLEQLKTQAQLAKTTFERQKRLWEQKIGSEIQYLQAKTNYEASENTVKQMESQLGKSTIRAPFSGIIDDVIKDQGTVVAPGAGSEIFRIVNLSDMYIVVEVPETYLGSIQNGKEAKVYFPVLGDSIMTNIRQTGNFINPGNRSFTVEIPVPNKSGTIKPNLSAKVQLNDYTSENAILIPQSIVSENADGEQYAYVAEDLNAENEAVVKKIIITTGKTQNGFVEVLSGISTGNHIIKEGARSVKDGQKVKVLN
ncbi:efflux RND transporter periplasmic adaptor subunit [Arenibacter sp. ARW7G5Y1]|uniref:efflux RND transporter periplasmic adaptor subunit n=1 Tax=Arenibacter sp. ARW7G5Y1 TaxID=2135619 RepID=UPI000D772EC4|nr:efflux RND transporter periplasmic adaptor subunit [Arenibacter sp. ARW7G5Y1]PXX21576.1 RND family efflux transporter MFP subunit [Arenibacter sp. ARW7G5Y1]|tara:strand:- start:40894 stop:42063 length:1170 start_codon:yes stop_codon:yes gene_type:complete